MTLDSSSTPAKLVLSHPSQNRRSRDFGHGAVQGCLWLCGQHCAGGPWASWVVPGQESRLGSSHRAMASSQGTPSFPRHGRGAKLIPETPGGNAGASPSSGSEDKRGTSGNRSPKSGLGAGPTHLVCSLTSDTEKAAVIWLQVYQD